MNHWAAQYIGKPWVRGAMGPEAYYCFSLFAEVQRTRFGIILPNLDPDFDVAEAARMIRDHDERVNWIQVDKPQEGDAVLMARRKVPGHIGVWIAANGKHGVLHCVEGMGVVFTTLPHLQIQGWGSVSYFRHKDRA